MTDFPTGIKDQRLTRLYAYWNGKRGDRRYPARADIDPLDFAYAMGWVALIDVSREPLRFRFRLHGSQLRETDGGDLTGTDLEDHPRADRRAHCARVWREVVETGEPSHGFYDQVIDGHQRPFEALRLPLSSNGQTINMLLVCTVPGS